MKLETYEKARDIDKRVNNIQHIIDSLLHKNERSITYDTFLLFTEDEYYKTILVDFLV